MKKPKKTFGQRLIESAEQAVAIAQGKATSPRVTRRSLSAGEVRVAAPPHYDAQRIRRLRKRLNMSQPVFARSLNASDATVKAWEQGKRLPDGTSLRLLELVEKEPDTFARVVGVGPK